MRSRMRVQRCASWGPGEGGIGTTVCLAIASVKRSSDRTCVAGRSLRELMPPSWPECQLRTLVARGTRCWTLDKCCRERLEP